MSGCVVYVCHPLEHIVPGMEAAVKAAIVTVTARPEWAESSVRAIAYDTSASLRVTDLTSEVLGKLGPVILLRPVQHRVYELLQEGLGTRTTVLRAAAYTDAAVSELLLRAKEIHDSGEPHLCRKYVVALLLLRKLDQEHMWAGKDKGFMWYEDIPKGRGLDAQFSDAVPQVLSLLVQYDLLVQKTSRSDTKYALNPDRREEIYAILRTRRLTNPQLARVLERDGRVVSCRALDLLDCYANAPVR